MLVAVALVMSIQVNDEKTKEASDHDTVPIRHVASVERGFNTDYFSGAANHTSDGAEVMSNARTFSATAYVSDCDGCTGITRYGLDVRDTIYAPSGLRVIAVDPNVIAPMSTVRVELASGESFEAVAADIGSAINGNEIDILMRTRAGALEFGRQDVKLRIINERGTKE